MIYTIKADKLDYKNHGTFSFIYREPELLEQLKANYRRDNIAAKIFFRPIKGTGDIDNYIYGHLFDGKKSNRSSKLIDAVRIQNICHFAGLAPRVFGIEFLEFNRQLFPFLVVEDVGTTPEWDIRKVAKIWEQLEALGDKVGFKLSYFDNNAGNVVGDRWVDFQGFNFTPAYLKNLKKMAQEQATWSTNHYQSIPELNVKGFRDTTVRLKELGLDKIDFKNKLVLDVGCSGGQFCMYAASKGAKRVVGLDFPDVIDATKRVANYLGYFNIDFEGVDLAKYKITGEFDIVLYLSMYAHIGFLPEIPKAVKELMVFETNGITQDGAVELLREHFSKVDIVGHASDFDGRSIIHCRK